MLVLIEVSCLAMTFVETHNIKIEIITIVISLYSNQGLPPWTNKVSGSQSNFQPVAFADN